MTVNVLRAMMVATSAGVGFGFACLIGRPGEASQLLFLLALGTWIWVRLLERDAVSRVR